MLNYIILGLIGAVVALMVYVRVAPTPAAQWHFPDVAMMTPGEYAAKGSHLVQRAVEGDGRAVLAQLDSIIRDTPRTRVLAGTVAEGKITYVTRSRIMGFPDFTTATLMQNPAGETSLQIFSRLRFGRSDMGVNRARMTAWLAQLDAATGPASE